MEAAENRARSPASPFSAAMPSNERAHWVRPELVAQVRFTEWTDDGKLRHPVYLGLREDKPIQDRRARVGREGRRSRERPAAAPARSARNSRGQREAEGHAGTAGSTNGSRRRQGAGAGRRAAPRPGGQRARTARSNCPTAARLASPTSAKVFWPKLKITKGDLLRYYATVRRWCCRRWPTVRW